MCLLIKYLIYSSIIFEIIQILLENNTLSYIHSTYTVQAYTDVEGSVVCA